VDLAPKVEAPLVFVGYGLSIPESNFDDLAGIDLKGKVAVLITGSPAQIGSALASHHQTALERWKAFRQAGAVGIISIPNPASMDVPWSRTALNRLHPSMELAGAEFNETQGEKLALYFNPAHADRLFEGSGHTFQELADLATDRKSLPHFPLTTSIEAKAKLEKKRWNQPILWPHYRGRSAVEEGMHGLSAHIVRGHRQPINGDHITTVPWITLPASLYTRRCGFAQAASQLKRSLLFVFVTGEREGTARLRVFCCSSDGRPEIDGGGHQHRHVPAAGTLKCLRPGTRQI
jgi:hypothetical protein